MDAGSERVDEQARSGRVALPRVKVVVAMAAMGLDAAARRPARAVVRMREAILTLVSVAVINCVR